MNLSQVALGAPSIQKLISSNPCYNKKTAPMHPQGVRHSAAVLTVSAKTKHEIPKSV